MKFQNPGGVSKPFWIKSPLAKQFPFIVQQIPV